MANRLGSEPLRVVFYIRNGGFVRNFASVIAALGEQGVELHLLIGYEDQRPDPHLAIAERLAAQYPSVRIGRAPARDARTSDAAVAAYSREMLDVLRYDLPGYEDAAFLKGKARNQLSEAQRAVAKRLAARGPDAVARYMDRCRRIEEAVPPVSSVVRQLRALDPHVVLVTPLVRFQSREQVDLVKAARSLGIPVGVCVASWDNLTNKGLMRILPDRVLVWNEAQKDEAVRLHGVPADRVVVTGAQIFDHWFSWTPTRSREAFCERVGLRADRPYLLYLCSSKQIASDERLLVDRWLTLLRSSRDPRLKDIGVLIRPHPTQVEQWQGGKLSRPADVSIWPRQMTPASDPDFNADYFDSMYYCAAAIGVNTSGQIEAGILGRPVLTWRAPGHTGSQDGTLHFHHLTDAGGGLLYVGHTGAEHLEHLSRALAREGEPDPRSRQFVDVFVRPQGAGRPATPIVVEAVREMATLRPAAWRAPAWAPLARPFLRVAGLWIHVRRHRTIRQVGIGLVIGAGVALAAPYYRRQERRFEETKALHGKPVRTAAAVERTRQREAEKAARLAAKAAEAEERVKAKEAARAEKAAKRSAEKRAKASKAPEQASNS